MLQKVWIALLKKGALTPERLVGHCRGTALQVNT
ncbi:hypothetical protein ABIE50_002554 [Chitinophaga sp. OAE865]